MPSDIEIKPQPPDFKKENKFFPPYFSPTLGSWEIDVV
jgi:hypothetical protein